MTERITGQQYLARGAWLAILLLQLTIIAVGLTVYVPNLHEVCTETPRVCQSQLKLTAENSAILQARGVTMNGYALFTTALTLVEMLLPMAIGILIFWRKPDDRIAWIASLFLVIGLAGSIPETLAAFRPAWWLPTRIMEFGGISTLALLFYLFPTGHFTPRWTRWAALAWCILNFPSLLLPGTWLDITLYPIVVNVLLVAGFFASFTVAQLYRYRRVSTSAERMQTKWVVYAGIVGILLFMAGLVFVVSSSSVTATESLWPLPSLMFGALDVLLPSAIGVSILRYRLWDIDVIIRRTLVYALLTAILAGVYFGVVVLAQQAIRALTGQTSDLAIVISTLAVAALFAPLRRGIQNVIDQRFFRKKYDAAKMLESFAVTARDEVDATKLVTRLIDVVNETLQPEHITLWLSDTIGQTAEVKE